MLSRNFFILTRLLILFLTFIFSTPFAYAIVDDKINVTDFQFYRKIIFKNQQLLIYKNIYTKSVFYTSEKNDQNLILLKKTMLLNFKITSANQNHKISYQNKNLSYFSSPKSLFFLDSNNSTCDKKRLDEAMLRLDTKPLLRSIQSLNIEKMTEKGCTVEQQKKLSTYLTDLLSSENSWLSKCYNNNSVNRLIDADPNYASYAGNVYSKYLRLVDKIQNNEMPIEISCQIDDKSKLASFNESVKPQKISFNWDELIKKSDTQDKFSDTIKQTLGHELFHYGEQMQSPLDNEHSSKCINELYARTFTQVCIESETKGALKAMNYEPNMHNTKILSSKEIENLCHKDKFIMEENTKSSDADVELVRKLRADTGDIGGGAAAAAAATIHNQQQAAVQSQLNQTVTASDFTQPTDSDFAKLVSATTPNTQDGKAYTVSANSDFGKVVQNTMNSFAKSGNTLTTKLNSAISATTPTAQATTNSLASNSVTSPNTSTTSSKVTLSPTNAKTDTFATNVNSRMPATEEPTITLKRLPSTSGQASAVAGTKKNPELGSGANTAFTKSTITGSMQTTGGNSNQNLNANGNSTNSQNTASNSDSTTNSRSPASINTANRTSQSADGQSLVKTIQSLKNFNSVSGGQYEEIKKQYTNPQFQNLLQTFDMHIKVKSPNGQDIKMGIDEKIAKKVFTDDGQNLKLIEPKK